MRLICLFSYIWLYHTCIGIILVITHSHKVENDREIKVEVIANEIEPGAILFGNRNNGKLIEIYLGKFGFTTVTLLFFYRGIF